MTTEEREKELQELDRKLRQQVQILLESKEGRDLWAGEIRGAERGSAEREVPHQG